MAAGRDSLDALLDYLEIRHYSQPAASTQAPSDPVSADNITSQWQSDRKTAGWLVPIAIGFQGLQDSVTPAGQTLNQRDPSVPHTFAEAVVTLGEFVMPHRFNTIDDFLWSTHYQAQSQLYLCHTTKSEN